MKLQLIWPILLMGLLSYYYSPVECRRRGGGRQRLPIKDEEGSRHVDKRKKASGMNPIAGYFILGAKNLEEKKCVKYLEMFG